MQDAAHTQEVDFYSPLDPSALCDDPVVLKQLLTQLVTLLRKETKRREEVERNMDLLLKKLHAPKSTPACPGQLVLFDTAQIAAEDGQTASPSAAPATTEKPKRKPKHAPHGRRRPPSHLEQVDVVHDLSEELRQQLGTDQLIPLPDVISFQYDYQAAKLIVLRHIQKKYLRREASAASTPENTTPVSDAPATLAVPPEAAVISDADHATAHTTNNSDDPASLESAAAGPSESPAAPVEPPSKILVAPKRLILPSCAAAPGLLAYIWLSKYGDHLPLYRLENITQRYGISFSRSTTCDWMLDLAGVLQELFERMIRETLLSRVLHTDDTTVSLQDPETGKWSTARFWNYIGDEEHPLTVLDFTRTHERTHPAAFLRDYRGYLQADAYNGYDGLYLEPNGRIIEVGCWQHARKRFKKAVESDMRATYAMAFIKSMYAIEEKLRERRRGEWCDLTIDERAARVAEVRTRETAPILKSFHEWMRKTVGNVLPKSDLGEALRYALNQWEALNRFTSCGLLDADNNEAERAHRGIAIGRKNWSFVGSERGGKSAAIHFSFIASCKMNRVEPFAYLVDVLERLPATPQEKLGDLLPHRWKPRPKP